MRIASYNVEWFNNLFGRDGRPLEDGEMSGRHDITRGDQLAALGIVFTAIDADAVLIVEAPDGSGRRSTERALENFAALYGLRTKKALMGFTSQTQQEIALLYDPTRMKARHDPHGQPTPKQGASGAPRFDGAFRWDLDTDAASEVIHFSKPPLEVALTPRKGKPLRLIGVHIKSKAPYGATSPEEIMRLSIENRRKQLAQCIWLRNRVEEDLDAGESLIVLGDFNDGPGLDEYEKLFGRSGVEIVLGERGDRCLFDPHASTALARRGPGAPTSARFYIHDQKRYIQALLDFIMVSADLKARHPRWRIWHPFEDPVCYNTPELREALLTASDHFPVTIDLPDGP